MNFVSASHDAKAINGRPRLNGKFLSVNETRLTIQGVTYGPFGPTGSDAEYRRADVDADFALMAKLGFNAVRVYTVPPAWLLDAAERHGLWLMVGVPWEQHVTFLDRPELVRSITERVRNAVRACSGHPSILCYAVGNEIPSSIVRWHGARRVAKFLHQLYEVAKHEDPHALITYVNYPSTEYLQLPFLDFVCFNVYLESQPRLAAYISRLHNLSGERPLVIGEIGLDGMRNGETRQADSLQQQVQTTLEAGCAGGFVFSWTDEWHRGGFDVTDWQFGLTRRDRGPKPALFAVADAFSNGLARITPAWPRISVVVCVYNGDQYLAETLSFLQRLDYPNYEVIVVDDGSTDNTSAIASSYPIRLIRTDNRGLSAARNTGISAATGEIVAYIDADAYPETEWLRRLAIVFLKSNYVAVGGPNIPPPHDSQLAQCVARAPGGPIHVLISDTEAEHIPGCNMAFRRSALMEIGGFDPQFRAAGDDVDVCWRLQERGGKLGFSPTAIVFHHRRGSARAYWKQQVGYGKAEGLLERKFPAKYNGAGHLTWAGRVYDARGLTPPFWRRGRVYQGPLGLAPFQLLYQPAKNFLAELGLVPEWYLVIAFLAFVSVLGLIFRFPIWISLLVLPAAACSIVQAIQGARNAAASLGGTGWIRRLKNFATLLGLHLMQPMARLYGRLSCGLHPWRVSGKSRFALPQTRTIALWSESWRAPEEWLSQLHSFINDEGIVAVTGGDYDRWDLEIKRGILASARTRIVIEEHGSGRQMVRFRICPHCSRTAIVTTLLVSGLAIAAGMEHAWPATGLLTSTALLVVCRMARECGIATQKLAQAVRKFSTPRVAKAPASKAIAVNAVIESQA